MGNFFFQVTYGLIISILLFSLSLHKVKRKLTESTKYQ